MRVTTKTITLQTPAAMPEEERYWDLLNTVSAANLKLQTKTVSQLSMILRRLLKVKAIMINLLFNE